MNPEIASWFEEHSKLIHQLIDGQKTLVDYLKFDKSDKEKDWYTPAEIARIISRRPDTVRGWCREKRLAARKRALGRANKFDWEISAMELRRYRDHGLIPRSNHDS